MEGKIDQILKNQAIIIQMLTDIIESIPSPSTRPDMTEMFKPILDNPIIKNNPAMLGMLTTFMSQMGGKQ